MQDDPIQITTLKLIKAVDRWNPLSAGVLSSSW
jgi:hypothetical protein